MLTLTKLTFNENDLPNTAAKIIFFSFFFEWYVIDCKTLSYYDLFVCIVQVNGTIIFTALYNKEQKRLLLLVPCVQSRIKQLKCIAAKSRQSNIDKACIYAHHAVLKSQLTKQTTTSSSPLHSLSTPVFSPCEPVSPLVMD